LNAATRVVSARAIAIGVACAALLCAFTPYNDFKVAATYIAGNQFPIGAIFVLFLLATVVNAVLRRVRPRTAFTQAELLTIWTLILVASGLPSSGMMRYFIPYIVAPHYYSDEKNNWESKIWNEAPDWLKIRDKAAADAFFTGYPRGQEHIPWGAWLQPLFFWSILALLFLLASFCVAGLLRRQWVENEKFAFPLVTLPILLAEEPRGRRLMGDLLYSPLLWLAAGLVSVLHTFKGLHLLYPSVPDITTYINLADYLTVRPWDQLGRTEIWFFPLVVGITYLLPAEVAFSIWFFYLFYKAEILLTAYFNWNMPAGLGSYGYTQFHALQAFGGAVGLTAWTLWAARAHLRDVWEKATGGPRAHRIDDSGEMLPYRALVIGVAVAYGGIGLWLYLVGVPILLIALALLILTIVLVVASWMICQAGMLYTQTAYGSLDVLAPTLGTAMLSIAPLYTVSRFEGMFVYDTREMLAPSLLNGTKAAEAAGLHVRSLFRAMALSVAIGLVVSAAASLWLPYYNGGANSLQNSWMYSTAPQKPLKFLGGAASVPYAGSWTNGLHIGAGFLGVLSLLLLRAHAGWGLHPIGFLVASVSAARTLWFSIFVGWVVKSLVQRYGGMKGYTSLLPFFLGLIVGDVLNAVVWIIIGYMTGTGYRILPG
jgi:hypothetical protein